jgi:potassium efflux system protein
MEDNPNGEPMPRIKSGRFFLSFWLVFLLALAAPGLAQPTPQAPSPPKQTAAAIMSSKTLSKVLAAGATTLEGKIKALESRLTESQQQLAQTEEDWQKLQVKVAALRAALAVEQPPLTRVQVLLDNYALLETQTKGRSKSLAGEADTLKQEITADTMAENTLRLQMDALQAAGEPSVALPETQQALTRYLQLADTRDRLAAQVWDNLDKTRKVLEQQRQLLAGLRPQLNKLEEAWRTELLKRPPSRLSLWEQLARFEAGLAALPGQGWRWLSALAASGALVALFWGYLFHLVGLLAFLALLGWSTRRLRRRTTQWFADWRARHAQLELLPIFVMVRILANSLLLAGLIFWVGFICWDFGVLGSNPAQFVLYLLGAWWLLRLALALVQAFFAGEAAAGVLPLGTTTSRFYRRSLKVFAVYLVLGSFALKSAPLLHFPENSRLFAEHFFLVGLMIWSLWLMRRGHLAHLRPALPDPRWVRRPAVARVLKGTVLFLLAVTVLADLLGLGNLAVYVAQATAWTGLAALLFWFLWLLGETIIHHLLHPELGWARYRYPAQQELVQRLYMFSRVVLSVVLGAMVILWSLNSWGVPPERVARAFRWLTWGPTLGPVKLTPLNLGATVLALYLGFWLSRLIRGLMLLRIFPRTGLDQGVQYTISTTVHYVVLILAVLVALTILGLPLTNLALVAGALGVGIGFGLQNIVNNFISGLILLFERPIKVGDLLVIDGQWGKVKEIRLRSTIFETFDRYVLIIPNSELVSNKVLNWTHYGPGINRLTLKVGVGYNSDVGQVTQLLTDLCRANPRVVDEPPPQIYFAVYGDSTLDFTIWVYLKTPADRVPATHELNGAILETLQQHGIKIPFPQRDLHLKDWPGPPDKGKL